MRKRRGMGVSGTLRPMQSIFKNPKKPSEFWWLPRLRHTQICLFHVATGNISRPKEKKGNVEKACHEKERCPSLIYLWNWTTQRKRSQLANVARPSVQSGSAPRQREVKIQQFSCFDLFARARTRKIWIEHRRRRLSTPQLLLIGSTRTCKLSSSLQSDGFAPHK